MFSDHREQLALDLYSTITSSKASLLLTEHGAEQNELLIFLIFRSRAPCTLRQRYLEQALCGYVNVPARLVKFQLLSSVEFSALQLNSFDNVSCAVYSDALINFSASSAESLSINSCLTGMSRLEAHTFQNYAPQLPRGVHTKKFNAIFPL